jgi:hypothetical protein
VVYNNCNQRKTTHTKHILRYGCRMLYYNSRVDFSVHDLFNLFISLLRIAAVLNESFTDCSSRINYTNFSQDWTYLYYSIFSLWYSFLISVPTLKHLKHILRYGCRMLYYNSRVDFSVHDLFNLLYWFNYCCLASLRSVSAIFKLSFGWLIDWCFTPTFAIFQLYCGVNKLYY